MTKLTIPTTTFLTLLAATMLAGCGGSSRATPTVCNVRPNPNGTNLLYSPPGCQHHLHGKTLNVETGSGPTRTQTVEQFLGACVIEAAWGKNAPTAYRQPPGSCSPAGLSGSGYNPASALCTYQSGNQWVCRVTAIGADATFAGRVNGAYAVTYDGQSIAYQRTGA